jgi:hypothetical protein
LTIPHFERRLLIGTSTSGLPGDTARRETAAQTSLAELVRAEALKLRFVDDGAFDAGLNCIAGLTQDAPGLAGRYGPRKPIVSEMLDVLADEAARRGCDRIALVNGDVIVRQEAVDVIAARREPVVALSRLDTGRGQPDAMLLRGVDLIAFDWAFWHRERRRFRPYIFGEALWDNVYTSIGLCLGGILINREPLIVHERHPSGGDSPYARYGHLLATRDRAYFSRWCVYVAEAERLRAYGGTIEEEYALQRRIFKAPGRAAAAVDAVRAVWWTVRHRDS